MGNAEKQYNNFIAPNRERILVLLDIIQSEMNKTPVAKKAFGEFEGEMECLINNIKELTIENYIEFCLDRGDKVAKD